MVINLDKIRQKVEQLSGNTKKSSMWSPKPGDAGTIKEYNVRIIPWPDGNDGQPFKERSFYYNIGGEMAKPILAPSQFSKEDPIQDLINKLRAKGTPEAYEQCKQFYSKKRFYAPIIVRGEEDEGVRLWSFGKQLANELLQAMLGDYGDITDPKEGRDVKITVSKPAGRQFADIKVQPRLKSTELGTVKQIKEWISSAPNLDEIYTLTDVDEIKKRVNDQLNGASSDSGVEMKKSVQTSSTDVDSEVDDVFDKLEKIANQN